MAFEDNGSMTEPPRLSMDNFSMWKIRMTAFLNFLDMNLVQTIKEGPYIPLMEESKWSDEDKRKVSIEYKARHILSVSLPNEIFSFVMHCESAKDMWDNLIALFEGSDRRRMNDMHLLIQKYDQFSFDPFESLIQTYIRFSCLINDLKQQNYNFHNADMLMKFLRSVPTAYSTKSNVIRHSWQLETASLQSVYETLLTHEY